MKAHPAQQPFGNGNPVSGGALGLHGFRRGQGGRSADGAPAAEQCNCHADQGQ